MITDPAKISAGDMYAIEGVLGVWLVTRAPDPADRGRPHVNTEKLFDGTGSPHLTAAVPVADLRPVPAGPPVPPDGMTRISGVRVAAGNGEVIIMRHPAAYASISAMERYARHLQQSVGLPLDTTFVLYTGNLWIPQDATEPGALTDDERLRAAHHHTYWQDSPGDLVPVVEPCHTLDTCPTSRQILAQRAELASGNPRFVHLDLTRERAEQPLPNAEYGMRWTAPGDTDARVTPIEGLAMAARAVAMNRELQQALGGTVDAELVMRRPGGTEPASPWVTAAIDSACFGPLAELAAVVR